MENEPHLMPDGIVSVVLIGKAVAGGNGRTLPHRGPTADGRHVVRVVSALLAASWAQDRMKTWSQAFNAPV